ncbi:MAG: hypothetical protein CL868_20790 [Cytophagaceae bacterium]|nr:hypothetical protein [Cytophagaceae bacterium]
MRNRLLLLFLIICCCVFSAKAQEEETAEVTATDSLDFPDYDPLKPSKAAFYSAVFPGLGQVYNKDYWKLPLVYGALGTGVGVIVFNDDLYQKYRTAYKERIAGRIDEFTEVDDDGNIVNQVFTEQNLLDAQDFYRRRKELWILVTAGMYILQIVEANVDAHLSQYDVDNRLSVNPYIEQYGFDSNNHYGLTLTFTF